MPLSGWVGKFALGCGVILVSCAGAVAQTRGVVELFTSQGCSSCPPADKLFGELASDPSLVVMSLPVDYWDYLGWKDTLANPANTARQRGYAHVRGDREVYTPQAIINGVTHVIGSDRVAVHDALTQPGHAGVMSVSVTLTRTGDELVIDVPGDKDKSGEVWLCSVARAVPVEIGRGENHGRAITYSNVVRHRTKLGDLDGKAHTWRVPVAQVTAAGADEAVVMVQAGTAEKPGVVLGAAFTALR